jgi:hypothetical protein
MHETRRLVRTPGSPSGRAARAAARYLQQDRSLAVRQPSGEGDARLRGPADASEQEWPRVCAQDAFGAKQQKIARA